MLMKNVILSDNSVKIIDNEIPKLNPNDVLVKMKTCGICGSDLEKVFGKYGMTSGKIGHEPLAK